MKVEIREVIDCKTEDNIAYLKEVLNGVSDIVYREFYIKQWKAALVYIDGMADKILLNDFVLETLMNPCMNAENVQEIKDRILTVTDIKEVKKFNEGVNALMSGDTLFFIDGLGFCYTIASRFWPTRGVTEPSSETVIRGSREGFTETIRMNTVLVRRRIRDTRLKVVPKSIGKRSKSDVSIMYIDDIVNKDVLKELMDRIENINIDAILDSGYIEQLIEDNIWSPFPQVQATERPDVVAAALYEGRVAVLVDNSPVAIIVPVTLPNLFQTPDDYYLRWMNTSLVRIVRLVAIITSLILPAMYIAITSYNPTIIPTELAYSIAASREGVPFPAFVETLIMEVSLYFLIEAIVRLPKPIGSTIGIVGGLIIGQAAVSAGIVSPLMIIIVSITVITNFLTPNYEVSAALRFIRVLLIIASAIAGMYGIMIGLIILLIHLVRLKSFGIPYLSPAVGTYETDLKDLYIRAPLRFYRLRPRYMETGDRIRKKD